MREMVRLGDVVDVVSGVGFPKELQGRANGDVPVFKVGDISNAFKAGSKQLRNTPNWVTLAEATSLSSRLLPAGTTVFAKIGEGLKLNRRAVLARSSLVDNNVMGLIPREELIHSDYLYYFMQTVDLGAISQATAVPSVRKSDVVAINLPLPALASQIEVVAEIDKQFSRLDEAVANLQRVKANLKRYKAAVLKAAVEGRLVETEASIARREGRDYETGDQLLRRVLVDRKTNWSGKGKYVEPATPDLGSLPALPDGWIWATAEAVCDPVVDCHNKTAPYVNSGIPLVRTTNIRDGQLLMDGMRFVDQPTYEFWSRRCPPAPGDVLFTREAPMGEACIVPAGMTVCLGQRTMLMRPSPAITASFLLAALMSPVIADLIDRVAVGSGVKHLRVGDVERLPIPLPPEAEQVRIVAELDRLLSVQKAVESEVDGNLQRAASLRSAVLAGSFQPGH